MPKGYILAGKDGRPSMKGTYSQMKVDSSLVVRRKLPKKTYLRVYKNNTTKGYNVQPLNSIDFRNSKVVRWGNRIEIDTNGSIVYNQSKNINNATNKKVAREIMQRAGVNVPKIVTPENITNADLPVICRPHFHAKGKNFITLNSISEFKNHYSPTRYYYSAFIDKVKEFRVHCAHSKILNFLEKPNPKNGNIAWNRAQNGEAFENVKWNDYNFNCGIEAIKAVKALELDFGGVDVLLDRNGKAWILEINTSPTLASSEYSMSRYAMYFDWLFRAADRRPHWDFSQFKKAESLAWKNFQLTETQEKNG